MNSDSYQKLEKSFKPFKLCFNNEIHRISKLPTDYKTLVQSVIAAFKTNLPASWALQYEDADGDRVMLTSDEDYRAMIECEAESSAKSIKIYLLPLNGAPKDFSSSELDISKAESTEYSQILPVQQNESVVKNESSEVAQPEEKVVVEEKIEEPAPEIKEEVPEPREEPSEPVIEERVEPEENIIEPKILAQNINNNSVYVEAAIDVVDDKEVKPVEVQEEPAQVQEKPVEAQEEPVEAQEEPAVEEKREWKHKKHCGASKESRKERIRPAVTEILFENVPVLAELIAGYLKDPSSFNLAELTKKSQNQSQQESVKAVDSSLNDSVVHGRVVCDGCGAKPILGIRYKCSVCEDFDYCEKCEASIDHPHPFLKIKNPKHQPKAVITILDEDLSQQEEQKSFSEIGKAIGQKISTLSKDTMDQVNKLTEKLFRSSERKEQDDDEVIKRVEELVVQKEKVEKPVKVVEEEVKQAEPIKQVKEPEVEVKAPVPVPVVVEKKVEEPALNATFVREICTIPAKITVNEKSIYKTIVIKNTGRVEWPSNTRIVNVSGISGQDVKLLPLAPGKEFSCILVIECPNQPQDYISEWRLIYTDEKSENQQIGETFFVSFAVVKPEIVIANIPLVESQIIRKEIPVPKVQPPKKIYPADVQSKAKTIKDIFPEANIDDLYEFISKTPKLSIEELLENYMA